VFDSHLLYYFDNHPSGSCPVNFFIIYTSFHRYDREIDAINEPYRPIPSGAISEGQVIFQIFFLLLGGLGISYGLDVWAGHDFPVVLALSVFGSFISYIYSAPPLKLKQNGWAGNYALGCSYISLPWWCGQAVFGELDRPVYFIL